ncbi:Receptor-interacting serine/threonine-protein kinase 2 [Tulasnella sp. UAMH 9824]|nr:Receptor-interacting serine/threonine-protein kinase 2 [Tulasnella sp. UAMH 9824]
MNPAVQEEIIWLRLDSVDGLGFGEPVLYRPDSIKMIPACVRFFPFLELKTSSELTQRRIEAVGKLDPKRILECYCYRFEDRPCMIVARAGEQPLSRLMFQDDLDPPERLKLLYEIGKSIQYLHSRSPPFVHGGVHPKYILISKRNSAVLSDFGLPNLWRLLEIDDSFETSSSWGTQYAGLSPPEKIGYTAPEYIQDDFGEMLPPADITPSQVSSWRRHPHASVTTCIWSEKAVAAITKGIPPDPEDHPNLPEDDSLWPLLQRMWSQNPADRPTIDQVMKRVKLAFQGDVERAIDNPKCPS